MDLLKLGLAGAAAYFLFGRKDQVEIISGEEGALPDEELVAAPGEIVAASSEEVVIATGGLSIGDQIQIFNPSTQLLETYVRVGDTLLDEMADGSASLTPDKETAMSGSYFSRQAYLGQEVPSGMGRSKTLYTARAPYKRGRNMRRYAVIGRKLPTYDACSRAGKKVADWRYKKINGEVTPQNAIPTRSVSNASAIIASTPCEVFSKVSRGEMTAGAAERRLRGFYAKHKDQEGLEHVVGSWT